MKPAIITKSGVKSRDAPTAATNLFMIIVDAKIHPALNAAAIKFTKLIRKMIKIIHIVLPVLVLTGCGTINQEVEIDCASVIHNAKLLSKTQGKSVSRASDFGRPGAVYNPGGSGPNGEIVLEDLLSGSNSTRVKRSVKSESDVANRMARLQAHMVRFFQDNRSLPPNKVETDALIECSRWVIRNQ